MSHILIQTKADANLSFFHPSLLEYIQIMPTDDLKKTYLENIVSIVKLEKVLHDLTILNEIVKLLNANKNDA